MKKRLLMIIFTAAWLWGVVELPAVPAAQAAPAFSDIKGHWAEDTINRMAAKGILSGFPDGTFKPDEQVKIDQFVTMLILSFTDLHPNGSRSWKEDFMKSLSLENQTILKQDYRYFTFNASPVGYWAKDFIEIANDLHFINKDRYPNFRDNLTRVNAAEIIFYTLQETEFLEHSQFGQKMAQQYGDIRGASEREQKFIAEVLVKGIMIGYTNGTFGVDKEITRAESLKLLERLTDKTKRIEVEVSPDRLERIVPTAHNGTKVVIFPDQRMWDIYEALLEIGKLRGANHDLYETTLRLYKDQAEKDAVNKQTGNSSAYTEEAAIWLDPNYNTYGVTIRLRDGSLARNQETIDQFANQLFGYNAIAFRDLFQEVCASVQENKPVMTRNYTIGHDQINVLIDQKEKTVTFSIAAKK